MLDLQEALFTDFDRSQAQQRFANLESQLRVEREASLQLRDELGMVQSQLQAAQELSALDNEQFEGKHVSLFMLLCKLT